MPAASFTVTDIFNGGVCGIESDGWLDFGCRFGLRLLVLFEFFSFLFLAASGRKMKGPHALVIVVIRAPVVCLPIVLFGLWCVSWRDHLPPFVLLANGLCHLVSQLIVVVCVALVVTFLSWFLEGLGDLLDLASQHNQAFLVGIRFGPGSIIKHVCIFAGGHLH